VTFAASKWARLVLVRRFVHIQPYDRHYGRLVIPSLACLAAMWLVHGAVTAAWPVDLGLTVVTGLVVYGGAYLAVGLTPAERRGAAGLLARVPLPGLK
jgi:hypothetical protein